MTIRCVDGAVKRITIDGHAPGERGSNVLCAAVSSIAQALHGYLANTPEDLIHAERSSGHADFVMRSSPGTDAVFKLCVIGLKQISLENKEISFFDVDFFDNTM